MTTARYALECAALAAWCVRNDAACHHLSAALSAYDIGDMPAAAASVGASVWDDDDRTSRRMAAAAAEWAQRAILAGGDATQRFWAALCAYEEACDAIARAHVEMRPGAGAYIAGYLNAHRALRARAVQAYRWVTP